MHNCSRCCLLIINSLISLYWLMGNLGYFCQFQKITLMVYILKFLRWGVQWFLYVVEQYRIQQSYTSKLALYSSLVQQSGELTHLKRPWCWERLRAGGEADDRGWDGWLASLTQWTWVWVDAGSWWWTGRSAVLQSVGSHSQTRLRDWTELNWVQQNILSWGSVIKTVFNCCTLFLSQKFTEKHISILKMLGNWAKEKVCLNYLTQHISFNRNSEMES